MLLCHFHKLAVRHDEGYDDLEKPEWLTFVWFGFAVQTLPL